MSQSSNDPATMIEMIKVTKQYPPNIAALHDISISISAGEMLFLIGRSGAGKTTLLKLLCGMETPSAGLIEINGTATNDLHGNALAKLRQKIGVAYQDFRLLLNRTVAENIAISMEVSYKKPQLIQKRVKDLLEQLDLSDKHDTIAEELSRGEQQRITLARSVANSPTMILVDEPTGNLDATTTTRVMDLLKKSNKAGATIVIATHDSSLYDNTSHRVCELRHGEMYSINGALL
ncbi:cell division ATP-binding protein FtsE [Desulfotalea psychrophila]|uniref:Cell division ATP-binding protein FtsE n=1 Tax=Desulfotalea psychrophila (strain LSv54 / DSM 12343) TaxID=177439 RepID=Q6AK44_DESPS|nr:cell division ATP-binding protein FtsE [Desulfotalea psychrophila]CAG37282.1 probable cell division ATP-binding protein (FtsE) [Desulfotalea psychrophila LSv54]